MSIILNILLSVGIFTLSVVAFQQDRKLDACSTVPSYYILNDALYTHGVVLRATTETLAMQTRRLGEIEGRILLQNERVIAVEKNADALVSKVGALPTRGEMNKQFSEVRVSLARGK